MSHDIASFDDEANEEYVGKLVNKTVEKPMNALLDEEPDQLLNADRYEQTASGRRTVAATSVERS